MRNYFVFDYNDSRDFGVYISGQGTFNAPGREYENIAVPGRDGDLLAPNTRLSNIQLTYPAFIYANFAENMASLKSMLLSRIGYKRLEDTYHPDEFRLAFYRGDLNPTVRSRNDAAEFDLTFECDPRRFLKVGENKWEITSSGTMYNPTGFAAKPLIRVYGSGTLGVGSDTITIASNSYPYIDIDSEVSDCYYGVNNANSLVTFSANDFPVFSEDSTNISASGSITKVEITPRWWRV